MGRPPIKDRNAVRSKIVLIRLNPAQHAQLVAAASKMNQPLAAWARLALIRAARTA